MNLTKEQLIFGIPKSKAVDQVAKEKYPNQAVLTLVAKDYSKEKVSNYISLNPKAREVLGLDENNRTINIVSTEDNSVFAIMKSQDGYTLGKTTNHISNAPLYKSLIKIANSKFNVELDDTKDTEFELSKMEVEDMTLFNLTLMVEESDVIIGENTVNESEVSNNVPQEELVENEFPGLGE